MEGAKSTPCVRATAPILARDSSDHSMGSYKSCEAYHDDSEVRDEQPVSVRSLIEKHKSFQDKLINAKMTDFDVKRKSFVSACETLKNTHRDCAQHVVGDARPVEDVEDFVRLTKLDY